jgi:hypothetical protein
VDVAFAEAESVLESLLAFEAAAAFVLGAAVGVANDALVRAAGRGLAFFDCLAVDGESAVLTSARAGEAVSVGCAAVSLLGTAAVLATVSEAGGVLDCLEQPAVPATIPSSSKRGGRRGRGIGMYVSLVQSGLISETT